MRAFLLPALAATAIGFSPAAMAQETIDIQKVPAGQTVLNISATERVEVQEDWLTASLRAEIENTDPVALQNEINTLMKKAVDKAKTLKDARVSTEGYYVYPFYPDTKQPQSDAEREQSKKWRGSQSVSISGKDAQSILNIVGELQAMGLSTSGLYYSLSTEVTESTRDSLMEAALKKIDEKAKRAGKAINKPHADLIEISIDTNTPSYGRPVMMRAMAADSMMEKSVSTPVAEPGMTEVVTTVTARVLLK